MKLINNHYHIQHPKKNANSLLTLCAKAYYDHNNYNEQKLK
jgi:hypothetical protein